MGGVLQITYGSTVFSLEDVRDLGETLEAPVSATRDITGAQIVQVLVLDNLEVGSALRFGGRLSRDEYQNLRQLVASGDEALVEYRPAEGAPVSAFHAIVSRSEATRVIPTDWVDVVVDLLITKTEVI